MNSVPLLCTSTAVSFTHDFHSFCLGSGDELPLNVDGQTLLDETHSVKPTIKSRGCIDSRRLVDRFYRRSVL
jgi:hypothetical protein